MTPIDASTNAIPPQTGTIAATPADGHVSHAGKLTPVQEAKLRKAAADFESVLLSTFWKSMKGSFEDDEESTDAAHDTLEDMGMQAMSSAVGKAGGLGLGQLILKHIAPELGKRDPFR